MWSELSGLVALSDTRYCGKHAADQFAETSAPLYTLEW